MCHCCLVRPIDLGHLCIICTAKAYNDLESRERDTYYEPPTRSSLRGLKVS